ncbi:MAG TPA: LexA family transcriptional regulator [Bacteroidia bacterium]|jgi:transcriptional regulator with XRE-family HTH domain|nr:LexA family transcriptional regulator [Bacteroidia bacterium]
MSKIAKNIKVLRDLKRISQEQLAEDLKINRSRLGAYEEGRNEPPIELLIAISRYFQISVDALICGDLSQTDPEALMKIGKNRILFPIRVDKENNDVIEVVPVKASAGYLTGYADPQFIQELPIMNLPFKILGKHRAFGIKGDSMPPLKEGAILVGKYVEALTDVKEGQTYIVLTKNDGLVYKRLYREKKKPTAAFVFHSDNTAYEPYTVPNSEILEIWSFVCSLNIGEFKPQDLNIDNVIRFLQSYRVEMGSK